MMPGMGSAMRVGSVSIALVMGCSASPGAAPPPAIVSVAPWYSRSP